MTIDGIGWLGVAFFWTTGAAYLLFQRYILKHQFSAACRMDRVWYDAEPCEERMKALREKTRGMQTLCSVLAATAFAVVSLVSIRSTHSPSSILSAALALVAAASALFLMALEAFTTAVSPSCSIDELYKLVSFGRHTYQLGFGLFLAALQIMLIHIDGRIAAGLCVMLALLFCKYLSLRYCAVTPAKAISEALP
jgi:hypothetical protein